VSISTPHKKLIGRLAKPTTALAKTITHTYKNLKKIRPALRENLGEKALGTKESVLRTRRKTIAIFRRPMNDISHISIMLVIIVALLSGLSASSLTTEQVNVNPFTPAKTNDSAFTPMADKVIAEANSVATIASIYSDSLGVDAAQMTDNLYKQTSLVAPTSDYLVSVPVVQNAVDTNSTNKVTKYVVQDGDTLSTVAVKFNVSTDTIRYASQITDVDSIKPGQTLTIPPVNGILYTAVSGDTTASIASKFNVSEAMIISQNSLYGEDNLTGMQLTIPDAEIPALPKPTPVVPTDNSSDNSGSGISYVSTTTGPDHFPYGYCTWWVASKRYVPWSGNAADWYWNAQAYGRAEGKTPVPGAIMVTWESSIGHVAYVESVNGNSFTVSEMNYKGYGIVDERTLTTSSVPLIGFIY
jgi:surface antigen